VPPRMPQKIARECSGGLLPPSPPAEKATARQDQTWEASTRVATAGAEPLHSRSLASRGLQWFCLKLD
jgi:hypothetical protein